MSLTGLALRGSDGSPRWLILASLALNLFFIGIIGALLVQIYRSEPPAVAPAPDRSVAARIERIAATLPRADADRLRTAYRFQGAEIDRAHTVFRNRQEAVRSALRAEPFDIEILRAAMSEMRAARQTFDRRIHDFLLQQAAEMSPAGRQSLAERPASRPGETSQPSRN